MQVFVSVLLTKLFKYPYHNVSPSQKIIFAQHTHSLCQHLFDTYFSYIKPYRHQDTIPPDNPPSPGQYPHRNIHRTITQWDKMSPDNIRLEKNRQNVHSKFIK